MSSVGLADLVRPQMGSTKRVLIDARGDDEPFDVLFAAGFQSGIDTAVAHTTIRRTTAVFFIASPRLRRARNISALL
jgi:hypothetical protein